MNEGSKKKKQALFTTHVSERMGNSRLRESQIPIARPLAVCRMIWGLGRGNGAGAEAGGGRVGFAVCSAGRGGRARGLAHEGRRVQGRFSHHFYVSRSLFMGNQIP